MTSRAIVIVVGLMAFAMPAAAQELSVPDTSGAYAGSLLHRRLGDSMLDHNRRNVRDSSSRRDTSLSPRARATCANKGRMAARMGRNHPDVTNLYALCARAGY